MIIFKLNITFPLKINRIVQICQKKYIEILLWHNSLSVEFVAKLTNINRNLETVQSEFEA